MRVARYLGPGAWPSRTILKTPSKWCILKGVLTYSLTNGEEINAQLQSSNT